jgi:hypothetical protein
MTPAGPPLQNVPPPLQNVRLDPCDTALDYIYVHQQRAVELGVTSKEATKWSAKLMTGRGFLVNKLMPKHEITVLIRRGNNVDPNRIPRSGWSMAQLDGANLPMAHKGCKATIYLHMLYPESEAQIDLFRRRVALKYGTDFANAMPLVSSARTVVDLPLLKLRYSTGSGRHDAVRWAFFSRRWR